MSCASVLFLILVLCFMLWSEGRNKNQGGTVVCPGPVDDPDEIRPTTVRKG